MRTKFIAIIAALSSISLASCEKLILEDRTECPAYLFFDISNADKFDMADYVHIAAFLYPEESFMNKDTTTVKDIQDKVFSLPVKRSESIYGYGVTGYRKCRLENETDWIIDEGKDFDPIWRFDFRSQAKGERFFIPVEMVKDHSNITVFFQDYDMFPGSGGLFPYNIIIKSNTCGINALTGNPVQGNFNYQPSENPGGTFKFTVPRQFDRSLVIQVWEKEDLVEQGGNDQGEEEDIYTPKPYQNPKLVAEFNVWNWAHANDDFSWTEKNLPDLNITIELTALELAVTVMPWEGDQGGYVYDF